MAVVTLGTDPEVFVMARRGEFADRVVPSYFALGRVGVPDSDTSEENPPPWWKHRVELAYGHLVGDGAAIEWTQHPTTTPEQMVAQIATNIHEIRGLVRSHARDLRGNVVDPVLSVVPALDVPMPYIDYLNPNYGSQFSLQILGCSPDFDVYTEESINRPDPKTFTLRTSGGHIHMGIGKMVEDYGAVCYLTALLDRVLGVGATMLCGSSPEYRRRMELYGRAGTIRIKRDIGVLEYRVLPAMALIPNPNHALLMFTAAQACASYAVDVWQTGIENLVGEFTRMLGEMDNLSRVAEQINTSDMAACLSTMREFRNKAPGELRLVVDEILRSSSVTTFDLAW